MRKFKGFSTVNKQHTDWRLYDIDLAKQDLLNEIYTRKGERLMSPSFGYIVWDLLFDPLTEEVKSALEDDTIRITFDPLPNHDCKLRGNGSMRKARYDANS